MNSPQMAGNAGIHYELSFRPLFDEGREYAFPCDAAGRVDMDSLSDRDRNDYLYARAVIGYESSVPVVNTIPDS
jgi:hypothetical protein